MREAKQLWIQQIGINIYYFHLKIIKPNKTIREAEMVK